MFKIVSIGTSFNHGLGLHFYERYKNNKQLTYTLTPEEQQFNFDNVFHRILANKLNCENEIFFGEKLGLNTAFDSVIIGVKNKLQNNNENIKIVIWQLSNIEKDFFIYNDTVYRLDFTNEEKLISSKNKLIETIDLNLKDDFETKLNDEINLWINDIIKWRQKNVPWFINKINEFSEYLENKGIILQIISYYDDYTSLRNLFNKNIFVNLEYNNRTYYNVHNLVTLEKLMICNDIDTLDQHPNFKAHNVVAESIYKNLLKHPLFNSI